ncbi:MAG TPA: isopeptide-forming domain-containing fimbrial protein [Candidatus Saccharimonadales bacterium]
MKKLIAAVKRAPKSAALVSMLAAAIVVPAALFAWGPDRPTYTYDSPADHVTFNSMTGTENYGDERNFVRIKEASAPNSTYADDIAMQPGKEYSVMVFFHNNAKTSLNTAENNYKGIAKNTKMRVQMPATVKAGEKARITGFISADNAQPQEVWDEAYGSVSNNVALRYVKDSAVISSNGAVDGQKLPETLYTTGAALGYDGLDGNLPGCNQYAGYVVFKVKVDQPNFEVEKTVSLKGKNDYKESVTTTAGSEVEYKIHYKNTGTTEQKDVVIKDVLPAGVSYVAGTTQVSNGASNFQWKPTTDNEVTKRGINVGNYAAGAGAYVKFTAKVADNANLAKCGVNTLTNKATAETNNGNKSDTADVMVTKTCVPGTPETPTTPTTPTELPKTGASDSILGLFGLGSVVAAASYYVASRRQS